MLGPLDSVTCKEAVLFTVYTGPLDPWVAETQLFIQHPSTPQLGLLDPVTCKEATPLYWVYESIRPTLGFDFDYWNR